MVLLIFYSSTLPITATQVFGFLGITFIFHTITDYFTSRIVSKKFEEGNVGSAPPNFGAFTIIGIDQVLHYIQLFTTYYLVKNTTVSFFIANFLEVYRQTNEIVKTLFTLNI